MSGVPGLQGWHLVSATPTPAQVSARNDGLAQRCRTLDTCKDGAPDVSSIPLHSRFIFFASQTKLMVCGSGATHKPWCTMLASMAT